MNASRTAGTLLIAVPLIFSAGFTGLQMTFEYPDILRQPAGEVLTRFAGAGADLHVYWYAMMFAALLMTGGAIAAGLHFWKRDSLLASLSIGAGVLAGLVQALGLLRWVMLVPSLAAMYVAPGATEMDKSMAVALFDAANNYLGMGVGEHLGYFFTAIWTALVSILVFGTNRIIAVSGIVIAVGVLAGMLEPYGVPMTGMINSISYSLWALWTLMLGVVVLRDKHPSLSNSGGRSL
jgi:cytochrome b subunit of formate dehydrogenase